MERNVKRTLILLTGLLAASLVAVETAAANEPFLPRGQRAFDRVDANRDGKVTLPEFEPLARKRLAKIDSDGDRSVTAAEIEARMQQALERRRDRIMALLDANKDGAITEAELDKVVEAMFNKADTDSDGGLTMPEIKGFKRGEWRKLYLQKASAD
jgi:Ca2+-binding EF-hand superfamily protein